MKQSQDRILTTHTTGSLARPPELVRLLIDKDESRKIDRDLFDRSTRAAVVDVVRNQVAVGLDVLNNDGEQSKISFASYVRDRLAGFGGESETRPVALDAREFPEYTARRRGVPSTRPTCDAPLSWRDFSEVEKDVTNLVEATNGLDVSEVFMSAASPGTIGNFYANRYYQSREECLFAIADIMKRE